MPRAAFSLANRRDLATTQSDATAVARYEVGVRLGSVA